MIKVNNKYNYPILLAHFVWLIFACIFMYNLPNNFNDIKATIDIAVIIITIFLAPFSLLIISITNKITKKPYNIDFEFITIPYLIFVLSFGIFLLCTI